MKKILILFATVLAIFSCTDKSNVTGNINDTVVPILKTINNLEIIESYSYQEEFINKNTTNLVIGKTDTLKTFALIKFPTINDTLEWTSAEIILTGISTDETDHSIMNIQAGVVNQNWSESTTSYDYAYTTSDSNYSWEKPFFDDLDITYNFESSVVDSVEYLNIEFDHNDLTDSLASETGNFGIVLHTDTPDLDYIFYSSEGSEIPMLVLKNNSEIIDTIYASNDAFIFPDDVNHEKIDGTKLQNIIPQSVYMNINFSDSLFLNNGVVEDTVNLKQIALNSARLVFEVDPLETDVSTYNMRAVAYMVHVDPDTMSVPLEISTHFTLLSRIKIAEFEQGDTEFSVDITPILQHFISNLYTNHGIVIRSTTTSTNFNCIKFGNPKLELVYTNYLEDEE